MATPYGKWSVLALMFIIEPNPAYCTTYVSYVHHKNWHICKQINENQAHGERGDHRIVTTDAPCPWMSCSASSIMTHLGLVVASSPATMHFGGLVPVLEALWTWKGLECNRFMNELHTGLLRASLSVLIVKKTTSFGKQNRVNAYVFMYALTCFQRSYDCSSHTLKHIDGQINQSIPGKL